MKAIPLWRSLTLLLAASQAYAAGSVTLTETSHEYILDNGIVTARVAKASGDLTSLRYEGREMLATFLNEDGTPDLDRDPPGYNPNGLNPRMTDHQYGFWSHDAMGPADTAPTIPTVTIDPADNDGQRAEVSVKGIAEGRLMGTGPGASPDGDFAADIEIRYALGEGDSGVYTYCIFEHPEDYPASTIAEARFCAKLNGFFDWMSLADHLDLYFPKELHTGDKYIFTAVQWENPAFGWSSTTEQVGFYLLNPTTEYLSGGPTKVEFLGHRDTNRVSAPCVLNYWRSSHYGGAEVSVDKGEHWSKVVGPFMLYVNQGDGHAEMYADAKAQQQKEQQKWPYDWVQDAPYANDGARGAVEGKLVLRDKVEPDSRMKNVLVGLTAPAYTSSNPVAHGRTVTWQTDAKHYQFWVQADADGSFTIPKVTPSRYTLHAIADGVMGEFQRADITVEPGKTLDLGQLAWTPVRHGRQVWEIGIPNRNGSEFYGAEDYADPEISLRYPKAFPDDVHYVIGQSDFHEDWFFQHVPYNEDPEAKAMPYRGIVGEGRATPYTIEFDLGKAPAGTATLRLAICGTGTQRLNIAVNDQPVETLDDLPTDGVITRHGTQGIWYQREVAFDASRLHQGKNTLTLTVPAGPINNGLIYDYLRLELDERPTH
ncbi:MAG: Rhamnogalacturonate lyase family [Puniceicoccaceae bacterium 5H]|nr:MAG: Rhamnogalacturonate lyase family [Puniceicoccaceae bacterium 5H]